MEKISYIQEDQNKISLNDKENLVQNEDDFFGRLQKNYPLLRKSERKIADYLQKNSNQRLDFSITEFAKLLDVSEATISRFCRVVGFQGFQDLKLSLAISLPAGEDFKNLPVDIAETDSISEIGKKFADTLARNIVETQRNLNLENIQAAVDSIAETKNVMLYGVGGATAVLKAANHLFIKAGIKCTRYEDGYMQTVTASISEPNSVALGVSHTGLSMNVVNALKLAAENGAITICITSDPQSPIAQVSQICLYTATTKKDVPLYADFLEARISQMYIIDLLYLGIIFKLGDLAKRNLKKSTKALRTYYNTLPILAEKT